MTDGELERMLPRYWRERQAESARQPHRRKAEAVFGVNLIGRLPEFAHAAGMAHVGGSIDARAVLSARKLAAVRRHLKAALALVDEVYKAAPGVDQEWWDQLRAALLSATIPAAALKAVFEERSKAVSPPQKRKRGAPSLRARFVERAAKLAPAASQTAWAHLGIAAGIDAPACGKRLETIADDYGRLLEKYRQ